VWITILPSLSQDHEPWNYLVLSVEWPPAFCYSFGNNSKCCNTSAVTGWNLHGLWPSNSKGADPICCKNATKFDINKLKPIMEELYKEWNPLGNCTKDFWAHEWHFHGSCACQNKLLSDELIYFNQTLQLKKRLDLTNLLYKHNVRPDANKEYQESDFIQVIKKAYNVDPILQCMSYKGKIYLKALNICFDNNLNIFECPKRHHLFYDSKHRNKCRKPKNSTAPIHIPCKPGFLYGVL